MTRLTAVS